MRKLNIVFLLLSIFSFAQKANVDITTEKTQTGIKIWVENKEFCPISIKYSFAGKNITSSVANDDTVLLPARKKTVLSEIKKIDNQKSWSFNYQTIFIRGDVKQIKGDDFVYSLPFEKGKTYRIDQGYNGNFSHQGKNALDFNLKMGEKVYASRDGIVIETKSDSDVGCPEITCKDLANRIIIYHKDGTFGEYAHFKKDGIVVKVGDEVKEGQLIGYSGNTGFSSGPHLHFDVVLFRFDITDKVYLETKFKTKTHPEGEMLLVGKFYE